VKVEMYTVKPEEFTERGFEPINQRPTFDISGGWWRDYFANQWDNMWRYARAPT
jgi:hypothetical protein